MLNKKIQVSVIIPTYNRANIIGKSIQSVLNQTFNEFELIIVDDGSTDNTKKIVESFKDYRIVYKFLNENRGVAAARNIGISLSKAEYIAFQDSDDIWHPHKLEIIVSLIQQFKNIDFIFSCGEIIKESKIVGITGDQSWVNGALKNKIIYNLFKSNFIPTQGVVIKKDKLIRVGGFDESFPSASDHELWLRLATICNFYFVNEPLYEIHFSNECITNNVSKRLNSQIRLFHKNKDILKRSVKYKIQYYIIRQIFISNIFFAAAWDISNRKKMNLVAAIYYGVAIVIFPINLISLIKICLRR